jgi:nucleoside-specific outer membrane channel protein Tsx
LPGSITIAIPKTTQMKKYSALCLLLIFAALMNPAFAQEKESKKKEKKKKLSKKEMSAQLSSFASSIDGLKEQVATLETENGELKAKVDELTGENTSLQSKVEQAERKVEVVVQEKVAAQSAVPSGLGFKIQIGAYKNFKVNQYFDKPKSLGTEDIDGYNKYIVGYFSTLEEAQAFQKDVKKMGIQDAWIVPYSGGQRISDAEAEKLLGRKFRDK